MTKDAVTQESFDVLLRWLDDNRETAGRKYEKIRRSLIWVFMGRGCFEAEELADETINRVTRKMPQLADVYVGEPIMYFFGVAEKIYLEWLKEQKKVKKIHLKASNNQEEIVEQDQTELEYDCLENCLATLHADQRRLVIEYYREEKNAKIEIRRELAENLGISGNALQGKVFRLRARLRECVRKCIAEKTLN